MLLHQVEKLVGTASEWYLFDVPLSAGGQVIDPDKSEFVVDACACRRTNARTLARAHTFKHMLALGMRHAPVGTTTVELPGSSTTSVPPPIFCCRRPRLPHATSAPGLGAPLPPLRRDWPRPSLVCTGRSPSTMFVFCRGSPVVFVDSDGLLGRGCAVTCCVVQRAQHAALRRVVLRRAALQHATGHCRSSLSTLTACRGCASLQAATSPSARS